MMDWWKDNQRFYKAYNNLKLPAKEICYDYFKHKLLGRYLFAAINDKQAEDNLLLTKYLKPLLIPHVDSSFMAYIPGTSRAKAISSIVISRLVHKNNILKMDTCKAYLRQDWNFQARRLKKVGISDEVISKIFPIIVDTNGHLIPYRGLPIGTNSGPLLYAFFISSALKRFKKKFPFLVVFGDDAFIFLKDKKYKRWAITYYQKCLAGLGYDERTPMIHLEGRKAPKLYAPNENIPVLGTIVTENNILPQQGKSVAAHNQTIKHIIKYLEKNRNEKVIKFVQELKMNTFSPWDDSGQFNNSNHTSIVEEVAVDEINRGMQLLKEIAFWDAVDESYTNVEVEERLSGMAYDAYSWLVDRRGKWGSKKPYENFLQVQGTLEKIADDLGEKSGHFSPFSFSLSNFRTDIKVIPTYPLSVQKRKIELFLKINKDDISLRIAWNKIYSILQSKGTREMLNEEKANWPKVRNLLHEIHHRIFVYLPFETSSLIPSKVITPNNPKHIRYIFNVSMNLFNSLNHKMLPFHHLNWLNEDWIRLIRAREIIRMIELLYPKQKIVLSIGNVLQIGKRKYPDNRYLKKCIEVFGLDSNSIGRNPPSGKCA